MGLRYDPFLFIFERGDEEVKLQCLEFMDLLHFPTAQQLILNLIKTQRPDGAFPSRFNKRRAGIIETVRKSLLLLKCDLPSHGVNIQSAVNFLRKEQTDEGGWRENPELEIPRGMPEFDPDKELVWVTAEAVDLLRQVGLGDTNECLKAINWLRNMQNEHGGWPCFEGDITVQRGAWGDPDCTAQVTFLMKQIYGDSDSVVRKGRRLLELFLDQCVKDIERGYWIRLKDGKKEPTEVYGLCRLFISSLNDDPERLHSLFNVDDKRVQRIFEALIDIQRADGGWKTHSSPQSRPDHTLMAVKVLAWAQKIEKAELKPEVEKLALSH